MNRQHARRIGILSAFLLLSVLILSLRPAHADLLNLKLSGPNEAQSHVHGIQISPDGQYALFLADYITLSAYELYSVPVDGSAPPTLLSSGLLPAGSEVQDYRISPDSSRVVYIADQDTTDKRELYSVAITGGPIVKLNPPIVAPDGEVDNYWLSFSPDSSRVVFITDWQDNNNYELFSIPADGGTAVRLNGDLPPNGTVYDHYLTPDGRRVVYLAGQDDAGTPELYIVPITGGPAVKLNGPLVAGGFIWTMLVSPDGSRVVYTAVQDTATQVEIYSVALTEPPGASVKLNQPLGANEDVVYSTFRISPDSSRVVYLADALINDVEQFFSVPIGGGPVTQLTPIASGSPETFGPNAFEVSPDSSRLVFRALYQGNRELFSVPLTGGDVTTLNGPLIENGDVWQFGISPDSSRVVYLAHQESLNSQELYSVPIEGGAVAKLNSALPLLGSVRSFQIAGDSERVVYVADQQVHGVTEIFSVPLADGPITRLNQTLVAGGLVHLNFRIGPDNNRVFYVAEQETDNVRELFVTFEETAPPPPPPDEMLELYIPMVMK